MSTAQDTQLPFGGTLDQWHLSRMCQDNYQVIGVICGDPAERFDDGDLVYTSSVRCIDFERGIAVTQNSFYELAECALNIPPNSASGIKVAQQQSGEC